MPCFNYRDKYKRRFGIDFGPDMAVHHIDFDRSNNDISNLILLPSKLHAKYHWHVSALDNDGHGLISFLAHPLPAGDDCFPLCSLRGLTEALNQMAPWVRLKMQLEMVPPEIFFGHCERYITPDYFEEY